MSDRDLSSLSERSPIGMFRSRLDGSFVYANPALARLLNYGSVDELMQVNLARDIYVDASQRERIIADVQAAGIVDGVEVNWRTRDGRQLIVKLYGQTSGANVEELDGSVVDITEARLQRDEIERSARTLELVVAQVPAVYWLVDTDLRILRNGGAIEGVLGFPRDQWLGRTLFELHGDQRGSGDGGIEMHQRALAGETATYNSEYRNKQLTTTIAPYYRDGVIVGAIGTSIDVTAATMLERRMIDAQRAESLGVMAGGLAHDFNNLLVAILGNADLGLRDIAPNAPGRAALENVRNASLRAAELTDQLMAYAGRGTVSKARVAPRAMLDELLRIMAPTLPENVRVDVALPSDLAIRGDAAQLRQVFMNLIGNARDAIGARGGRIVVTGRVLRYAAEPNLDDIIAPPAGSYIEIEFTDDGPGIDRETRRRIFEPFFTTKSFGHGLGLAAVLGIVRAHGGGMRVTSEPGHGATFSLLWPATFTPVQQAAVTPEPTARLVLVIDDEDMVRDVVARMIEDLGYHAITAADGILGLELVEQQPVDAVLVDLTMPRMNGHEVVAALRQKRPGLPVILCTGFDLHGGGAAQADAYLPKPFRIDALEQTLARVLQRPPAE